MFPEFLLVSESLDRPGVDVVESVDNFDLGNNLDGLGNLIFGLAGFSACSLDELNEFLNFVVLALDLLEHALDVFFVIIAFLAFVLELQLK